jgi:hypothetical protein
MFRLLILLLISAAVAVPTNSHGASTSANLAIAVTQSQAITIPGTSSQGGVSDPTVGLLPADRDAYGNWKMAGLQSLGGISAVDATRTTQCGATLTPLGGDQDDQPQIQSAINNCTAGDYVSLGAGTFTIAGGEYILLNKSITVRGAGPGQTIIEHQTTTACPPSSSYGAVWNCSSSGGSSELFHISPVGRYVGNTITSCALTADAAAGSYSVSVTSSCASNFAPGAFVILDEADGTQWMPDPESPSTSGYAVWASPDYRVTYGIYAGTNPPGSDSSNVSCNYVINCRVTNEIKHIISVSGTTVTFDSPVMLPYRVSQSADLWSFVTPFLQGAGVEDLSLLYGDNGAAEMDYCAYCWLYKVEVGYYIGQGIHMDTDFRPQLEDFYVHEAVWPVPGSAGYNIDLIWDTSEALIENGISILANKVDVARGSGAGSVFGYNYFDKGYIGGDCCWQEIGLNASHLVGPHHVLFEGNWTFNMDSDDTHGASNFMTFFRNWSTAIRGKFQGLNGGGTGSSASYATWNDAANNCGETAYSGSPLRAAAMQAHSYWFSFIGNILGTPGCTTAANSFPLNNQYGGAYNSDGVFLLGWYNAGTSIDDPIAETIYPNTPPTISCPSSVTCAVPSANCTTYGSNCTTILDGNFDTVHNAQVWASNDTAHTLPNSFYLTSAPSFFSGYTWPWVNPFTGTTYTLPALARYNAENCSTAVFQNGTDCAPF